MSKLNLIAEAGKLDLTMSRTFDAPLELVYQAVTDPKAIPEWWGQRNSTTIVDQMDVKKGGIWRYIQREADGSEYAFNGVYHEIVPNERVTYTFEFEGMMGHILLETVSFEERDSKTTMTTHSVFQSVEDRNGMIASGMEAGAAESMDLLAEYLAKIAQTS